MIGEDEFREDNVTVEYDKHDSGKERHRKVSQ